MATYEYPIMRHTTLASSIPKEWLQTVPICPFRLMTRRPWRLSNPSLSSKTESEVRIYTKIISYYDCTQTTYLLIGYHLLIRLL